MLLFVEIMLDGGVDMSATFDSFESCSHLLKCDRRSFKSERNVLTPSLCRGQTSYAWICNPEVAGSIPGRVTLCNDCGQVDFFGDDAAFYRITSISCLQ